MITVRWMFLAMLVSTTMVLGAQDKKAPGKAAARLVFATGNSGDLFGKGKQFIENIGQYGDTVAGQGKMGKVCFGFEGFDGYVFFTPKGLIHLQRKAMPVSEREREARAHGEKEELIRREVIHRTVVMEWVGANPHPQIVREDPAPNYYTYSLLQEKAHGFSKLTYKELYPGIDVVYLFNPNRSGFEYRILVRPGADLSAVKMRYDGDVRSLTLDVQKNLVVRSAANSIIESRPVASYSASGSNTGGPQVHFIVSAKEVSFFCPNGFDHSRTLIIDPFVTNLSNLALQTAGLAKDIDFDYAGNVYIAGGSDPYSCEVAKFNASGTLLWSFSGTLVNPVWKFGELYGGWCVDKISGQVYMGNGFDTLGNRIVRLSTSGVYDNYISDRIRDLPEVWKMVWRNTSTGPELLLGGGNPLTATNYYSLGLLHPPLTVPDLRNLSGFPHTAAQDVADLVIDSVTNQLYAAFATISLQYINGRIFKYDFPWDATNTDWFTGNYGIGLFEAKNRPFMPGIGMVNDNSANLMAVNDNYLFAWNDSWLAAFSKATGNMIQHLTIPNIFVAFYQGGIFADACNNVFVGSYGKVRVFHFDGVNFNDAAAPDFVIPGFEFSHVFDMDYNPATHILYVSGARFVAAFDISSYASGPSAYTLSVVPNCSTASVSASLSPALPQGATVTYTLFNGSAQVASNTTGSFSGLNASASYTIKAVLSQACGTISSPVFTLSAPALSLVKTDACPGIPGSITATGSGGTGPFQYSIDGVNFQTNGTFSGLAAGGYLVTVKDNSGCTGTANIVINNCLSASTQVTPATCTANNGSIAVAALNGTPPYTYSMNGGAYQSGNIFSGLGAGTYHVTVKDAAGTLFNADATVNSLSNLQMSTVLSNAGCAGNDGSITVTPAGGTAPFQYSLNGLSFQSQNIFSNLSPGNYVTSVKDASGCLVTHADTVKFISTLHIDAGTDKSICEGKTTLLSATSNGGSIAWSPATGLSNTAIPDPVASPSATTTYYATASLGTCSARDSVTVFVNPAPVAYAGSDAVVCFGQSIQLMGSGGVSYQWSPSLYLSNSAISSPTVVNPLNSMTYAVSVTDALGCTSLRPDSVQITVDHSVKIFAGSDTTVSVGQPLQLNAVGLSGSQFISYLWYPATGLSNAQIQNPVSVLNADMMYTVTGWSAAGCQASDSIYVKVFTKAEIYVPSAFTPNADGRNDVLKPILQGIQRLLYFKVFNRWGALVFSSSAGGGWNGNVNGKLQPTGSFVWIAKGIDFKGNIIERKGTATLIR